MEFDHRQIISCSACGQKHQSCYTPIENQQGMCWPCRFNACAAIPEPEPKTEKENARF